MAHVALTGDREEREIPAHAPARSGRAGRDAGPGARGGHPRRPREAAEGPVVRIFVGAGRQAGIRPGDLVGAITGEAGIESREIGGIEIADRFALVEVPEGAADRIIKALRATTIRGRKVPIRRDRDAPSM